MLYKSSDVTAKAEQTSQRRNDYKQQTCNSKKGYLEYNELNTLLRTKFYGKWK